MLGVAGAGAVLRGWGVLRSGPASGCGAVTILSGGKVARCGRSGTDRRSPPGVNREGGPGPGR